MDSWMDWLTCECSVDNGSSFKRRGRVLNAGNHFGRLKIGILFDTLALAIMVMVVGRS